MRDIQQLISEIQKTLNSIDNYMKNAPEGSLKAQKKSGRTYFYHQYQKAYSDQCVREYIKKENISLAQKLAQKGYFIHVKPILIRNLCALQEFVEKYDEDSVERIYDKNPEMLILETERGEMVRSKSELIIANMPMILRVK